jgi:hypothetical protein
VISLVAVAGSLAGVVLDLKAYKPFKTSYWTGSCMSCWVTMGSWKLRIVLELDCSWKKSRKISTYVVFV